MNNRLAICAKVAADSRTRIALKSSTSTALRRPAITCAARETPRPSRISGVDHAHPGRSRMSLKPNFSSDLTGPSALVTGASSGLGLRFATTLASCGAKVAVTGRRQDRLEAVAETIRNNGGVAIPLQLDVTDADQLLAVVGQAEAAIGPIDILVNN